jgi:hypothetical protein
MVRSLGKIHIKRLSHSSLGAIGDKEFERFMKQSLV